MPVKLSHDGEESAAVGARGGRDDGNRRDGKKARREPDEDPQKRKDNKDRAIASAKKASTAGTLDWMSILTKLTLKNAQELGDLRACVYETWLLKASSAEVVNMTEQGAAYATQVKKKGRGHNLGPPMAYIFAGLMRALIGRGEGIGTRNLEQLKEGMEAYDGEEMEDALEYIKMCRVEKTYLEGTRRLTFCIRGKKDLKRAVIAALGQTERSERKMGRPPPSFMERDLQGWLESMTA